MSGLINLPILSQVFNDRHVQVFPRNIDKNWMYEKVISSSVSAFNPFHRRIYVATKSSIWDWIKAGKKNDRKFNESDCLVQEVLFLIHDYLHAWSCLLIQNLMPGLKYGYGKITEKNFEDFVFCHLLTEAVATVGLDYWYLSTIDLNKITKVGTGQSVLTVSYHEKNLEEFRKFDPNMKVQSERFYEKIATFYCTGQFKGFDVQDLKDSPILRDWLDHELTYGSLQRKYTRQWLSYLSNGKVIVSKNNLEQSIKVNKPWQKALMKKIAKILWDKIKNGVDVPLKIKSRNAWSRRKDLDKDFRFTNINSMTTRQIDKMIASNSVGDDFPYFFSQYISMFDFSKFPQDELDLLSYIREKKDLKSLAYLFKKNKTPKIKNNHRSEPMDLFFLN